MLVGGVIVGDQMQVDERADRLCARNELAGERDQRGKQRDGAVARVIVRLILVRGRLGASGRTNSVRSNA